LFHILVYSFLLPIAIYLFFRKRILDKRILVIVLYSITIFIFLFFELPIKKRLQDAIYTITEFSFFALLIFQQLKNRSNKILLFALSILFILIQIIHFTTVKRTRLDSIPIAVETIFIFFFIFLYFQELLKNSIPVLSKNYFLWIAIGILIYLGGSFFIYILANNVAYEELVQFWFFTYIVEIIKNILLVVAMIFFAKNQSDSKQSPQKPLPNLDFTL
jgi:hypothetical protein